MADTGVKELQMVDTKVGTGAEAVAGRVVSVHYTGWLFDAAASSTARRIATSRSSFHWAAAR